MWLNFLKKGFVNYQMEGKSTITIFSGGLIYIWCTAEHVGQKHGVCKIESK